jgi:hypothetical protein
VQSPTAGRPETRRLVAVQVDSFFKQNVKTGFSLQEAQGLKPGAFKQAFLYIQLLQPHRITSRSGWPLSAATHAPTTVDLARRVVAVQYVEFVKTNLETIISRIRFEVLKETRRLRELWVSCIQLVQHAPPRDVTLPVARLQRAGVVVATDEVVAHLPRRNHHAALTSESANAARRRSETGARPEAGARPEL